MTSKKSTIYIEKATLVNGVHEFEVTTRGTIHKARVPEGIKFGEPFEIDFGDGSYVPYQREKATWLGRKGVLDALDGSLENSIKHSKVFIGESVDSDDFYKRVAKKYCKCTCAEPWLLPNVNDVKKLLAFDLDHPKYARQQSRQIIYLSPCNKCNKDLTHGNSVGSFCTTGEDKLKALANKEAGFTIDFESIITSCAQLLPSSTFIPSL